MSDEAALTENLVLPEEALENKPVPGSEDLTPEQFVDGGVPVATREGATPPVTPEQMVEGRPEDREREGLDPVSPALGEHTADDDGLHSAAGIPDPVVTADEQGETKDASGETVDDDNDDIDDPIAHILFRVDNGELDAEQVLAAEQAQDKPRKGLVKGLESRIAAADA